MEAKPFALNFEQPFDLIDVNGLRGYQMCLREILQHVQDATEWNPAKRMIDSVQLLERITETNEEIGKLLIKAGQQSVDALKELSGETKV